MKLFFKIVLIFLFVIGSAFFAFYFLFVTDDWYKASAGIHESKFHNSYIASFKMEPSSVYFDSVLFQFDTAWVDHPRHVKLYVSGRSGRSKVDDIYSLNLIRTDSNKTYPDFQMAPLFGKTAGEHIFTENYNMSLPFKSMLPDTFAFTCSDFKSNIVFDTIYFYKIPNSAL